MLTSVVAAAYIIPSDMGIIQSVLLVVTYLNFLQLGVFNGLNRNIALYKSRNNLDAMHDMVDTSYQVSKIISSIGAFIGIFCIIYYANHSNDGSQYVLASILLFITLVLTPLRTHLETTYRSGQEFGSLGKIIVLENIVFSFLSLLPIFIGFLGKIIADAGKLLIGYLFRIRNAPILPINKGTWKSYKELVSVGFPLLISGYLWTVFSVADQTYIVTRLGSEQLGLYTLSRFCLTALIVIPSAIGSMLYPKAAAIYGKNLDPNDLKAYWYKSILLFIIILIPIIAIGILLLPSITHYFLPKYIDGLAAAKITLLSGITFVSMGPAVIIGTLRKNFLYIIAISSCIALFWSVCYIFPSYFSIIENVAKLRFSISIMLSLFVIIYTYYLTHKQYDKQTNNTIF